MDGSDIKLARIPRYLGDLGFEAVEQNRWTLAMGCELALDKRGGVKLNNQVVNTIAWQETQMLCIQTLLNCLARSELIQQPLDPTAALESVAGREKEVLPLNSFSHLPEIRSLEPPPNTKEYVWVLFEDDALWL